MKRNQTIFLILSGVYRITDIITGTLVSFYLWQTFQNFYAILILHAFLFVGIALAGLLTGTISKYFGLKRSIQLAMFGYAGQLSLFILLGKDVTAYLPVIGLWIGLASGIYSSASTTLSQEVTSTPERAAFLLQKIIIVHTVTIIFTPLLASIVQTVLPYKIIFGIALILYCSMGCISQFFQIGELLERPQFKEALTVIQNSSDLKKLFLAKIFFGIQDGLFWVTLGLVTLAFVGSVSAWGFITTVFTILSIGVSFIYRKYIKVSTEKYFAIPVALFFATTSILLVIHWNLPYFILYLIGQTLLLVMLMIDLESYYGYIIDSSQEIRSLRPLINGLSEWPQMFGRLLPIILLGLLQIQPDGSLLFRIFYLAVAFIPLQILAILRSTKALDSVNAI